jgi:hypothetical protein
MHQALLSVLLLQSLVVFQSLYQQPVKERKIIRTVFAEYSLVYQVYFAAVALFGRVSG